MNEAELLSLVKAYKESHIAANEAEARMANNPEDPDLMDAFGVAYMAEFVARNCLLKFVQKS